MISRMEWGMSTDMTKVFKLLLDIATQNKLSQDNMIEKIFVLTDMEFNCALSNNNNKLKGSNTSYFSDIKTEYEKHGYKIPQIIFWNLHIIRYTTI